MAYLVSLMLLINLNSLIMMWVCMEINMLTFISMMISESKQGMLQEVSLNCFFYFLIQSLGSFAFIFSFLLGVENSIFSSIIFVLSMVLKLGIFPLYFWVYKFSKLLSESIFSLFITIQKIPFIFFIFTFVFSLSLVFIFLSSFAGSFLIYFSFSFYDVMISSSIYSTFWVILLLQNNVFFFFSFFLIYFFSLSLSWGFSSNYSFSLKFFYILLFVLFFLGVPPLSLFFYKILISFIILHSFSLMEMLIFWFPTFFSLVGYFKMFYLYFFSFDVHCLNNQKFFFFKSIFYITLSFFLIFLLF